MDKTQLDKIDFVDAEQYTGGSNEGTLTYNQIILEQIRRCVKEGSTEMVGGHYEDKQTKRGLENVYIPDQKQVYIQSVKQLLFLMIPLFDDIAAEEYNGFINQVEGLMEEYKVQVNTKATNTRDRNYSIQLLKDLEKGYINPNSHEAKSFMENKLDLFENLFTMLNVLYDRKGFGGEEYIGM